MSRGAKILLGAALAASVVCLSATARGPSEEDDEAQQRRKAAAARPDVLRLADSLDRDENEIEKQAHAVAEKHELHSVMWILKPHDGFRVLPKSEAPYDGIELQLFMLAKKPMAVKDLEASRDDLIRMTKVIFAVSRVAPLYAMQYADKSGPKDRKTWPQCCGDMQDRSQDLIDALKGDDVNAIQSAAASLKCSCEACHSGYRDSNPR
ncbi:MAG TPA: hypothetical protein VMS17_08315 [Gemmataceae bacterium]|nr:hypothetical protein [Gemmataceae bacterium]